MKLVEMSWPEVGAAVQGETPVVALLPIAAIEQHGPHLAVSTDTALVTGVAERVEQALPDNIVLCPTLAFGSSHHHLAFPGTMSISHETYIHVLLDLVESLLKSGFRRIVLLNGHGGNIAPAGHALTILSHRHDDELQPNIALATYWEMDGPAFKGAPPMETASITHADEYETSMMLYLYPERVHLERAHGSETPAPNGYISWQNDQPYRGVTMSKRMHFLIGNGSNGKPELATAAKGEHLISRAVAATVAFIEDFKSWPFMQDLSAEDFNRVGEQA